MGSANGLAQWVRDPVMPQLQRRSLLQHKVDSDLWRLWLWLRRIRPTRPPAWGRPGATDAAAKKKRGGVVRMITCIPGTYLFLSYNSKTNDKAMVRPEPGHEFKAGRKKTPSLSVALTELLFALPKGTLPRG